MSVELPVSSIRKYVLLFECEKSGVVQEASRDFYYDTQAPKSISMDAIADADGNIEVKWNESFDEQSQVKYLVYRNSKQVYSGSKFKFVDDSVEYPNSYAYEVVVMDEAGNKYTTPKVSVIPKKVRVIFSTNLKETQKVASNVFPLELVTDINSSIDVKVLQQGVIIDQKHIGSTTTRAIALELSLAKGLNEVKLVFTDFLGNTKEASYFIEYVQPIVAQVVQNTSVQIPQGTIEQVKPQVQQNTTQVITSTSESSGNFWWYVLGIGTALLIGALIYVKFFHTEEDPRRRKRVPHHLALFSDKKEADKSLASDLIKVRQQREKALAEKQYYEELRKRKEKYAKMSDYRKKMLDEIGTKKQNVGVILSGITHNNRK
jgi:hypothetical protein